MIFFCPICWKEIEQGEKKCPHCGSDITEHENKGFEEKLINSLRHPERETVQRAVWILGKLRSTEAVKPLAILFELTDDSFLKIEILNAFYEMGTSDAVDLIVKALDSVEYIVRRRAKEIIEKRIVDEKNELVTKKHSRWICY